MVKIPRDPTNKVKSKQTTAISGILYGRPAAIHNDGPKIPKQRLARSPNIQTVTLAWREISQLLTIRPLIRSKKVTATKVITRP